MVLLLLTGCAKDTPTQSKIIRVPTETTAVVCDVLEKPLDKHMRSIVKNGEAILGAGADEVLVTGSELSDTFDGACN